MALAGSDHFVANFNVVQTLSRSIDRVFEDAQLSGILSLSGRNLKEFPSAAGRYDLADTVVADLSRNRLTEFPVQLCEYGSLETLILYHNSIRSVPLAVQFLASLTYLDLSRNQLVTIPSALTLLPLEVLILNSNRIQSVPGEICRLGGTLMELDISCNKLASLPLEVGDLGKLRVLNARENLLSELPLSLNKLRLRTLDVSSNKLSFLDTGIRCMVSLIELNLDNNPLVFPPAKLCDRGCVHIFKSLELESTRRAKRKPSANAANTLESTDLLDRRRYRMATAAALNGNDAKLTPMNNNDYKYNNMSMSTMEHRRKYRHRTIASETRYYLNASADDCCNQWTGTNHEGPAVQVDQPSMDPLRQKRSPPIGEEVPPPPPSKIESAPLPSKSMLSPREYNRSTTTPCKSRSPRSGSLVNGTSLVEEVMAACESEIVPTNGAAITKAEEYRRSDSLDEISSILRKQQEQDASRRRNATDYVRHVKNESGLSSSRSMERDSPSPAYPCESISIDRPSTSPVSFHPTQHNRRHLQRATYSIKEETESSPPMCSTTACCSTTYSLPFDPKSPPKSARSDVIQSIYTASTNPSNSNTPTVKKLVHPRNDQGDVHPCCPSHGTPSSANGAVESSSKPNNNTDPQHQHQHLPVSDQRDQRPNSRNGMETQRPNSGNGMDTQKRENVKETRRNEEKPADTIRRDSGPCSEERPSAVMAKSKPTASNPKGTSTAPVRQESARKSLVPSADGTTGQKRTTTNVNGIVRTSTSGQLSKGPSQTSLTSSMSSHRLNVATTTKGSTSGTTATNGVTVPTTSASKKLSPSSSLNQDVSKNALTTRISASQQKADTVGPVFNRASQSANQHRSSRGRESLANGVAANNTNSRKDDRYQYLIEEMRQVLEKTLKITLPSSTPELTEVLSDGVHLCNFVNALRPRTIPSVHVPTDSVTKLPAAKCRRNVENFLMGCRRLGVAESQLFGVNDVAERRTLSSAAKAVQTLVKQAIASNCSSASSNGVKLPSNAAGGYAKMTNV